MLEGTGKYFFILFVIFFIVYLTVKICLAKLFEGAKIPKWKAYIPFYNRLILVNLLDLKKSVFYKTLIPIYNLYIYNIIIRELLKAYQMDPKDSIWYVIIPMYKFPELVFKHPKFLLHMYDDTEEFINNQNILFEVPNENVQMNTSNEVIINPETYNQGMNNNQNEVPIENLQTNVTPSNNISINPETYSQNINNNQNINQYQVYNDNVFSNASLQPDERKETFIQAKVEEKKEEKPIVVDKSKPVVCPKCGTKLSPTATTCFLCGTKIL